MSSLIIILICSFLTAASTHNCVDYIDEKNENKIVYSSDQYMLDCSSVDKYVLFAVLYNYACPRGKGTMNGVRTELINRIEAKHKIDKWIKFYSNADIYFIDGMYMKTDLSNWPHVNFSKYDSHYGGPGTFENLYNELKERNDDSVEITMFSKVDVSLNDFPNLKKFTKVKFSQEVVELLKAHNKSNLDGWFLFEGISKNGSYEFISTAWEWIYFSSV